MKCLLTVAVKPLQSKWLLVMKLTALLTLVFTLNVSANGFGQEKINLRVKKTAIEGVLRSIEQQTNYRFLYNNNLEDIREKVTLNVKDADINDVLALLLEKTRLLYQVMGNNLIVIKEDPNVPVEVVIRGKVFGEGGMALEGASVQIKGTTTGTSTNNEGIFSLTAADANVTLIVSSVGYDSQEIALGGRTEITVALVTSTKLMDQVVVIGYGTANKRDLTGSIVKISGREIADKPNANPVASLQSKVAGLSIVNNGTPGAAPDIRIRGTISIGSVTPLYVVDGIFNDNIDYLNPNDIESIEILKDPSSLAIFGVRGAAGVIAVTTKRAKAGQVNVNFSTAYGFKKLTDKIKFVDAAGFRTLYDEERSNLGVTAPFDYAPWTANTDWIDAVTRTGQFSSNNVSVTGSTEKNKFALGVGYILDEGIIKHEKLQKITLSFNDELKLNKNIKVGFNFNGARQNLPYGASWVLDAARKVIPIVPSGTKSVYTKNPYGLDSANYDLYQSLPPIQASGVVNPLIQLENEWDNTKAVETRMVGSVFAEISFLRNFSFRTTFYGDISNVNNRNYTPLYLAYDAITDSAYPYTQLTSVRESDNTWRKFQQDYILNYKKDFGDHSVSALAGFTTYYFGNFNRSASVQQSATGAPIPDDERFWYIDNGFGDAPSRRSASSQSERSTASALFRAFYSYKNKYLLNGSFRRDGSSQISPANRWQEFWAVGAAWEISQEDFMQSVSQINFLKLKASVGVLGNQNTYGYDYPFYPGLVGGNAAVFGQNIYLANSQAYLPNPNLKWETVNAKEIGIEGMAFSNRLRFEVAYFNKVTRDLMTYIPGISGAQNGLDNIGKIRNSGIELSGGWTQQIGRDAKLTIDGNFTTYDNKVLELASKEFSIASGLSRTTVGLPIGYFYGYIVEGLYQSYADKLKSPVNTVFAYGPGDFKYKDTNGDGIITADDRTMIGNPTPDFAYGGSINFSYKGLDIGVDVGGVFGNEVYRNWGSTESPFQRVNYPAFKLNRWHGEGTSNWDPVLGQDHRINYEVSTYGIEDGSYFRIRNLQLGYNLDKSFTSKLGIKNLRVFANVQNLKTWKNNSGYTPEFGGSALSFGVDNAGGAIPVVTTFGINANF
jgi:TonB-linked SusC/RagA family outer membrane protein